MSEQISESLPEHPLRHHRSTRKNIPWRSSMLLRCKCPRQQKSKSNTCHNSAPVHWPRMFGRTEITTRWGPLVPAWEARKDMCCKTKHLRGSPWRNESSSTGAAAPQIMNKACHNTRRHPPSAQGSLHHQWNRRRVLRCIVQRHDGPPNASPLIQKARQEKKCKNASSSWMTSEMLGSSGSALQQPTAIPGVAPNHPKAPQGSPRRSTTYKAPTHYNHIP